MIEADVWRALIAMMRTGMDNNDLSGVKIKQSFQPVKQGVEIQDTVYLFKITSKRVGHQGKSYVYNSTNDNFDSTENYWLEATFQLTAKVKRDITDSSSITAYDVADKCAAILQSDFARNKLLESIVGILRIRDIRNPYSLDDTEQFDQDTSFDFILTYNNTISSTVPKADPVEAIIKRV